MTGRGSWIRTNDLQYPKLPRYQAALYPDVPESDDSGIHRHRALVYCFSTIFPEKRVTALAGSYAREASIHAQTARSKACEAALSPCETAPSGESAKPWPADSGVQRQCEDSP